jgi:hypothetical protein
MGAQPALKPVTISFGCWRQTDDRQRVESGARGANWVAAAVLGMMVLVGAVCAAAHYRGVSRE